MIVPEQATEEEQESATDPDLEEVLEEAAATINVLNQTEKMIRIMVDLLLSLCLLLK